MNMFSPPCCRMPRPCLTVYGQIIIVTSSVRQRFNYVLPLELNPLFVFVCVCVCVCVGVCVCPGAWSVHTAYDLEQEFTGTQDQPRGRGNRSQLVRGKLTAECFSKVTKEKKSNTATYGTS